MSCVGVVVVDYCCNMLYCMAVVLVVVIMVIIMLVLMLVVEVVMVNITMVGGCDGYGGGHIVIMFLLWL